MKDNPSPLFESRCLHCGAVNDSISYSCPDHDEPWIQEYRSLDLKAAFDEEARNETVKSFNNYRFDDQRGLLQYHSLPLRTYVPEKIETVGLTALHHLENLGKRAGCNLFLKDEADNPSGCFKDRETLMCLLNSRKRGLKHAVIYSSGNAAASAALFAQRLDLKLITFVAGDTYDEKIDYIRDHGSDVVVIGDEKTNFEEGFRIFARLNAEGVYSSHHYDNWSVRNPYRVQGDKTTAIEIASQLAGDNENAEVPDYVIVPTANGSCLAGIWKGFKELYSLGIINRLPKMVSCGIRNANPVFEAVERGQIDSPVKCDLSRLSMEDETIGSTIIAEEGYDSIEAAKAVIESNGLATVVDQSQIKSAMHQFLDLEGEKAMENLILPEPCSYISLAAVERIKEREGLSSSQKVVSLVTGHGLKARELMDELLSDRKDLLEMVHRIMEKKEQSMTGIATRAGRRKDVQAEPHAVREAFESLNSQIA